MKMGIKKSFLICCAMIAAVPVSVEAQTYYAREQMENLPATADPGQTFSWSTSAWSGWSSSCSDNAVRTRTVSCRNGDGAAVADALCTTARPASSETQSIKTGCVTYAWQTGAWSEWDSHCSDEANRTRTVSCTGSNGSTGTDAQCTGTKPVTSETAAVTDQCPPPKPACEAGIVNVATNPSMPFAGYLGFNLTAIGITSTNQTVWRVRNSTTNTYRLVFGPSSGGWSTTTTIPGKTDIDFISGATGAVNHKIDTFNQSNGSSYMSTSRFPSSTPYTQCG